MITSIDKDNNARKRQRLEKVAYHEGLKATKEIRKVWQSDKSDCLEYVNLMVDYFNFVNSVSDSDASENQKKQGSNP